MTYHAACMYLSVSRLTSYVSNIFETWGDGKKTRGMFLISWDVRHETTLCMYLLVSLTPQIWCKTDKYIQVVVLGLMSYVAINEKLPQVHSTGSVLSLMSYVSQNEKQTLNSIKKRHFEKLWEESIISNNLLVDNDTTWMVNRRVNGRSSPKNVYLEWCLLFIMGYARCFGNFGPFIKMSGAFFTSVFKESCWLTW